MGRLASVAVLCAAAIGAGCTSPASHFYTLSQTATSAATAAAASPNLSLVVGPVSMPAAVDLPQIVVSTGPNQVMLDEFNRWASPLQDNVSRVVAENLAAILGTSHVSLFQTSLYANADYRVAIEIQGFDSALGEAATLNAVWTVRRTKDGKTQAGRTTIREPLSEKGYDALAAGHSRALGRMSQDIADAVLALERAPRQAD